jgi:hypothetical protein
LEWASEAAGTDEQDGAQLEPYVEALAQVWAYETGRRTSQRLIDSLGLDRLDLTPRQRHALSELATLYDHRRDLRDAFDISHGDRALALIDWASHVSVADRGDGPRIEALREQFEAIMGAVPSGRS